MPEHTAGAIVYAFRQPGGATIRAVGLDALDADGRRPGKRWRRTFGQKKGAAFVVGAVGGDPLVIVEGEVDALASVWLHPGEVWAAGGLKSLTTGVGDPADEWTDTLGERAAIMEFDGGVSAWLLGVFLPLRGPSCFCGPVSQWDGALAGVERGG